MNDDVMFYEPGSLYETPLHTIFVLIDEPRMPQQMATAIVSTTANEFVCDKTAVQLCANSVEWNERTLA